MRSVVLTHSPLLSPPTLVIEIPSGFAFRPLFLSSHLFGASSTTSLKIVQRVDLDHHDVQTFLRFEGSRGQGGEADQEVVSRACEVEVAGQVEQSAGGEVGHTWVEGMGWNGMKVLTVGGNSTLTSPIVTLAVGREPRLFAAHEDVLSLSPFFVAALRGQFFESTVKQVQLPDE